MLAGAGPDDDDDNDDEFAGAADREDNGDETLTSAAVDDSTGGATNDALYEPLQLSTSNGCWIDSTTRDVEMDVGNELDEYVTDSQYSAPLINP